MGAVLSQIHDGEEKVICYANRCLSNAERKYCVTFLRNFWPSSIFVKHFRHYFYGKSFLIRTDHSSLRWLLNKRDSEGQLGRWVETLSTYEFEIQHWPWKMHTNADALSWMPCRQCEKDNGNGKSIISKGQFRSVFEEKVYSQHVSARKSRSK